MVYVIDGKKIIKIFKIIIVLAILMLLIKATINYILPVKYDNIIEKYAKEYNLEKEFVLAVINVESRFDKNAVSNKGAIGLMQIMPDTGKWLAEKIGIKDFSISMLYVPEINVQLGCYYLSDLLKKFEDEILALCAYNAGTTNVYKWLKNEKYALNGKIHTIPFKETDKYVKKINIIKKGYSILLKSDT